MPENIDQILLVGLAALAPFIIFGIYYYLRKDRTKPQTHSKVISTKTEGPEVNKRQELSRLSRDEPTFASSSNENPIQELPTPKQKPLIIRRDPEVATDNVVEETVDEIKEDTKEVVETKENEEVELDKTDPEVDQLDLPTETKDPVQATEVMHEELDANRPFPAMDKEKVNEFFYYVVRMQFKLALKTTDIRSITNEIISSANLRMYETIFCFNQSSERWETPRPDNTYHELYWAVPLCNRNSKLTTPEMAKIVKTVETAMRKYNGIADFPTHMDVEERQKKVEEFCNNVDKCIHANLIANSNEGGVTRKSGDIYDLAIHHGLEEINGDLIKQVNGETWYKLTAGSNQQLSKISPDRKVASVIATLDVPHVTNPLDAYDEMFDFALKLSRVINFQLVDTSNNVIDKDSIANTRKDLESLESYMRQSEVLPGSKLARALFS